jgi:hypothetical protein
MYKYAHSTKGFYLDSIHGANIPADAVEIDQSTYDQFFEAQSNGRIPTIAADGTLTVTDPPPHVPPPPPTLEQRLAALGLSVTELKKLLRESKP